MKEPRWANAVAVFGVMSLLASLFVASQAGAVAGTSTTYIPSSWNGKDVYLSPSNQFSNIGCDGYNEGDNMEDNVAPQAAIGAGYDLRARTYRVRIGYGSPSWKKDNSNAWGADIHIPLHSNWKSGNCSDGASHGGTKALFASSGGLALSNQMIWRVGVNSPGTNDNTCVDEWGKNRYYPTYPLCTKTDEPDFKLTELWNTSATASYLEADFHSFQLGVDWLESNSWTWRIGYAVDKHLGYPRPGGGPQ